MVIRGNIRGNGPQLADYLLTQGENELIEILEVDGRKNADAQYLHQTINSMSLMAELTKSDKGLYHAQINPAYEEDKQMDDRAWHAAADILAKNLGYENQRRAIVLHQKKGRIHAHVVFERYDYGTGKLIDNKQSRLKQDAARKEMEVVFKQKQTPHRNPQRAELKEAVTNLWNKTANGAEFIKAVSKAGYLIAEGTANRPFMIVDENARSFDLVRQLKGIRTKEVRERLRNEKLLSEKLAIKQMRELKDSKESGKKDTTKGKDKFGETASLFAANQQAILDSNVLRSQDAIKAKRVEKFLLFKDNETGLVNTAKPANNPEAITKEKLAKDFYELKNEISKKSEIDELAAKKAIAELMAKNSADILKRRYERLLEIQRELKEAESKEKEQEQYKIK